MFGTWFRLASSAATAPALSLLSPKKRASGVYLGPGMPDVPDVKVR
jgi:hypothetical protein